MLGGIQKSTIDLETKRAQQAMEISIKDKNHKYCKLVILLDLNVGNLVYTSNGLSLNC